MDREFERQRLADQLEDLKDEHERVKRVWREEVDSKQTEIDRIQFSAKDLEERYEKKLSEKLKQH